MFVPHPILAAFVTPGLFFVGAGAVAAPILIHLFARRRFKRIRWAAVDFLIDAQRRNRRRVRMEEWILLALRCAAMLFIALLVARPFLRPRGLAASWAGHARVERVFVMDDSYSMDYSSGGVESFARAQQAVRGILESVRAETPDDTVTILRMTAMDSPVESGTYLNDAQTESLLARLEALAPTQQTIDPPTVVQGVATLLQRNPGILNAAVYFISDFQRGDWTQREVGAGAVPSASSMLAPLQEWAKDDRVLRLVLINVGDAEASNRAVVGLGLEGGPPVAGADSTVRVGVANASDQAVSNLELRLTVGDGTQPPKTLGELSARQSAAVEMSAEFLRAGHQALRVELPADALPLDNIRYLAVDVSSAIRVLIVDGEASADEFADEVSYLKTALRPEGDVFSGNETVVVDEAELEQTNLNSFHAVILANVYRVSEPAVEALERFVRQGGGVIFFLGDQVDADLYNSALYRDGDGMLPASLGERIRAAAPTRLVVTDRLHPAMRGFSREGDPLGLGHVPFLEYFACTPKVADKADGADQTGGQGDSTKSDAATSDAAADRARPTRVIARFSDTETHPAMIERPFGSGRVLMVTTSADKEWHEWPDHPTYLPVVMEWVRHVARRADGGAETFVGQPITLPLDSTTYTPEVLVRTPAYPGDREVSVTARPDAEGRGLQVLWEHTEIAGIYQFVLRSREGGETIQLEAVNLDPRESDLSTCNEAELRRALTGVPFEYVEGVDRVSREVGEARAELWRPVLVLAFLALMTEQTLAWRWGRRR